jgi:DNA-binding response OmpR family regulator
MTSTTSEPGAIRLAVIDADSGFLKVLSHRVAAVGWQQRVLASAVRPEELVSMRLNALVVDLAVLGPAGWDYVARVCRELPDLGVIVCTGPSTVAQRVRALRMGADDWVSKPCHPEEVLARVEAVVRRRRRSLAAREVDPLRVGDVVIRPDQFQAFVDGRSLDLTRREYELLVLLADMAGQVVEREEIYQRVWGYTMAHGDRSVDVFVRKLRQKLERHSPGWKYIHTHFGIGYRLAPEPLGGVAPAPAPAGSEGRAASAAPAGAGGRAASAAPAGERGRAASAARSGERGARAAETPAAERSALDAVPS